MTGRGSLAPATVVVTALGSAPAQAFVRGLREQDELAVRVVGLDTSSQAAGLLDCDRHYTIPRVSDPDFVAAIVAVCEAEEADVLVPIADFELQTFADLAARLEDETGVHVITNRPEAVRLATDKQASAGAVAAHGVAVPREFDPQAVDVPAIVKPVVGAGSRGVTVVRTPEELAGALSAADGEIIIQQFIDGPEFTVDLVVAPEGQVLAAAPRVRVEVRAGQSYKGVTVDDADVEEAACRAVAALGITAQANVQFIRSNGEGRPYFVECPWQDRMVAEVDLQAIPSWREATRGSPRIRPLRARGSAARPG